jgi:hypothetical protein
VKARLRSCGDSGVAAFALAARRAKAGGDGSRTLIFYREILYQD